MSKVNPVRHCILGGKPRSLVFSNWASYLLEEEGGQEFVSGNPFADLTPRKLTLLLWAAMAAKDKSLEGKTDEQRRDMIRTVAQWIEDAADKEDVVKTVFDAWVDALPEAIQKKIREGQEKKEEGAASDGAP